jgi:hypothetical protein
LTIVTGVSFKNCSFLPLTFEVVHGIWTGNKVWFCSYTVMNIPYLGPPLKEGTIIFSVPCLSSSDFIAVRSRSVQVCQWILERRYRYAFRV